MTREEAIEFGNMWLDMNEDSKNSNTYAFFHIAIKALEQEPCEMTAEEYRQRMIQAFHNADTDELIAVCVLPTEKEFEHLEWLLKNHYKKEPCTDAISRQALLDDATRFMDAFYGENGKMMYSDHILNEADCNDLKEWIKSFPPVIPAERVGRWEYRQYDIAFPEIGNYHCSSCDAVGKNGDNYCSVCGAKMQETEE